MSSAAAEVLISSVTTDSKTLYIQGAGLISGPDRPTMVLLGQYLGPLLLTSASSTEISALLPAGISPGSYLLTVGYGVDETERDQAWVTLTIDGSTPVAGVSTLNLKAPFSSFATQTLADPMSIDVTDSGTVAIAVHPTDSYLGDWTMGMTGFQQGALKPNYVMNMGWNVTAGGSMRDTTKPAGEFSMESHYTPTGTDADGTLEMHWQFVAPGAPSKFYRAISTQFYPNGITNTQMVFTQLLFKRADTVAEIGRILPTGLAINGVQTSALNVTGTSVITGTQLVSGKLSINSSALGSKGLDVFVSQPGAIAALQSNAAANGNSLFPIVVGNAVTGSLYGPKLVGSTTGNLYSTVQQNGTGNAVFDALVLGTGDAKTTYSKNGGQAWAVGLDQSDGAKFKVSASSALGTNDVLTIAPSGDFVLGTATTGKLYTEGGALKYRGPSGAVTVLGAP